MSSLPETETKYISLIHDENQVSKFEEICRLLLNADVITNKFIRPSMLINLSFRTKYMTQDDFVIKDKANFGNIDKFFIRKLFTKDTNLIDMIKRLEVKEGCYKHYTKDKKESMIMKSHALSVYICLNPRDQIKALNSQHADIMNLILDRNHDAISKKIDQDFYSYFHKSTPFKYFIELDIDTKDKKILNRMAELCPEIKDNLEYIVETKNGYHVLFQKEKVKLIIQKFYEVFMKSSQFNYIEKDRFGNDCKKKYVSVQNDTCLPIVGTYQGGFPVRFVDFDMMIH